MLVTCTLLHSRLHLAQTLATRSMSVQSSRESTANKKSSGRSSTRAYVSITDATHQTFRDVAFSNAMT